MKRYLKFLFAFALAVIICANVNVKANAATKSEEKTSIAKDIKAIGVYANWDGVSNVVQFVDKNGNFCFAYDNEDEVVIVKTDAEGKVSGKKLKLKKEHSLFGNVMCDDKGNYYLVTGEENPGTDTDVETVFISKYSSKGKLISTVGDNGSSSLASYYGTNFYTKYPFDAGNCHMAINNGILSVNYARKMYSGHQSNSVFSVDTKTMKKVNTGVMYESHSFAQRVVPFKKGFAYASEGDCYERAFTINTDSLNNSGIEKQVFHFWVSKGAFDRYDMFEVNDNFAHMGGLANLDDNVVALVGTSVKSLNSDAYNETEQLFIQVFDPDTKSTDASTYKTTGKRTGLGGKNGDEKVTDYGVKWLTNFGENVTISNPQVVAVNGKAVVLFEKYENYKFVGTYYMVVKKNGKISKKATLYSKEAHLNPCTMPVYTNGKVQWVGNKEGSDKAIFIFGISV